MVRMAEVITVVASVIAEAQLTSPRPDQVRVRERGNLFKTPSQQIKTRAYQHCAKISHTQTQRLS